MASHEARHALRQTPGHLEQAAICPPTRPAGLTYGERVRVLIAHTKGGVGKTTTAVHLAAALAEDAPTILVDLDTNPAALDWATGGRLPMPVYGIEDGRAAMRTHQGHTVIDAPARPGDDQLVRFAEAANLVVIPTPPADLALRALRRVVATLANSGTPYRVLLTLVPPYPSDLGAWARDRLTSAGVPLFRADIPRMIAFEHATNAGGLVHEARGGMRAWDRYRDVAREVLHHAETQA